MVSIHVKLFTTCTSTCTYSKDMQCGSKNMRLSWKQQLGHKDKTTKTL